MTVLIIGGGWSGLAAAITLAKNGRQVHLLEAAKQCGGRARNVKWQQHTVDNGQHLMIGAYDRMLAMMKLIGIDEKHAFERLAIDIELHHPHYDPLHLSAKSLLPWPLSLASNLIKTAGISGLFYVGKLQTSINKILQKPDISVADWLIATRQPQRLIEQLWEPLCLATLNTPIDQASAHLLATALKDSMGKGKTSADLLIAKLPLGDLFPHAATNYIKQYGGKISLQTRAKQLIIDQGKVSGLITKNGDILHADTIVLAASPGQNADLAAENLSLHKPAEYPIYTVYLQYDTDTRLKKPMLGMTGTVSQWIFDRSEQTPGLMAVVISGPGAHQSMDNEALIKCVSDEVHQLFNYLPPQTRHSLVIREKRATFACHSGIESLRPQSRTDIKGLWLAGDFVANRYPATLEGAIRNGENCALQLLNLAS